MQLNFLSHSGKKIKKIKNSVECVFLDWKTANRNKFYADSQKSSLVARQDEKKAVKFCPIKLEEVAQGIVYVQDSTAS